MARTWISVRVELVEGGGASIWPRPGRLFVAAHSHTFAQLATAIDDGFARWDRAHLHTFELPDRQLLTGPGDAWDDPPATAQRSDRTRLSQLELGTQFLYTFDLGDDWTHLCTVAPHRVDPYATLGTEPGTPTPYWGWGPIPDQYGREFNDHEELGELDEHRPADPELTDLPPLRSHWGPPPGP